MINLFCLSVILFASADEYFKTSTDLWRDPTLQVIENSGHSYYDRRLRDDALLESVGRRTSQPKPTVQIQPRSEAIITIQNKINRIEQRIDYVNNQSARLQKLNAEYQALGQSVNANARAHTTDNITPDALRWNELRGQMLETQAMLEKEGKRALDEAGAIRTFAKRNGIKISDVLGDNGSSFRAESFGVTYRIFENKSDLETLQRARVNRLAETSGFSIKMAADQITSRALDGKVEIKGINGTKVQWEAKQNVKFTTTFGDVFYGEVLEIQNAGLANESLIVRTSDLSLQASNFEVPSSAIAKVNVRSRASAVPVDTASVQLRPSNSALSDAIHLNQLSLADPASKTTSSFSEGVAGASMESSSRSSSQATR